MVAKQFLSRVVEDFVGEYILNLSKEKLKIALLRGKLKIEDVELDGDLIGSHILGAAVGLSGFGVLSCYAKEARLSVPWKNLEKEPTRVEFDDIHLVCIPLLPSTANRIYGTGTPTDPKCTLRTRAKRSSLARLERNFFSRRIPGEGPPDPRILRAMKREKKGRKKRKKSINLGSPNKGHLTSKKDINETDISDSSDEDINNIKNEEENETEMNDEQQKNWKVKLRTKLFRNMDIKLKNIHIRCEVPERSLGIGHISESKIKTMNEKKHKNSNLESTERAFAFGVTVESFVYKSANKNWETGHIKWDVDEVNDSNPKKESSEDTQHGNKKYKVAETHNMSFYWDDNPPILLSECHILKNNSKNHSLSRRKIQTRISSAMRIMIHQQDPGNDIRQSLEDSDERWDRKTRNSRGQPISVKRHVYIIEPSSITIRLCFSNIDSPLAPSCSIDLLSCKFNLLLRPSQYQQYKRLRDAMFTQQRIDTMLHQRPLGRPTTDPRGWWNYIISCVVTRPHSRPWRDILIICKSRARYLEIVEKKLILSSEGGCLTESENSELLMLQDLLPIEALLSFHLVALRKVLKINLRNRSSKKRTSKSLLRSLSLKGRRATDSSDEPLQSNSSSLLDKEEPEHFEDSESSMSLSISKEPMKFSFQAHSIEASLKLLDGFNSSPIIVADIHAYGYSRISGNDGTSLIFDLQKIDVFGCQTLSQPIKYIQILTVRGINKDGIINENNCDKEFSGAHPETTQETYSDSNKHLQQKRNRPLNNHSQEGKKSLEDWLTSSCSVDSIPIHPPDGVVCRLMISLTPGSIFLNIAALPATITWNKTCFEAFASFFQSPAPEMESVLRGQLRDTATPLAHRAQLALISPMSISLMMNIDAPKILIPVSEEGRDGALFIDAGRFLVSFRKKGQVTATHWEIDGYNLQVKFVKDSFASAIDDIGQILYSQSHKNEISTVISPFPVRLVADLVGEKELKRENIRNIEDANSTNIPSKDETQRVNCDIGIISLNLVNAEVLAKAIGKYYATQVLRVKHLNESNQWKKKDDERRKKNNSKLYSKIKAEKHVSVRKNFLYLSVSLEKIEMILEGHSKVASNSTMSNDIRIDHIESLQCKYIIELFGIKINRDVEDVTIRTRVLVQDISIRNSSLPPDRGKIVTASPLEKNLNISDYDRDNFKSSLSLSPGNADKTCPSPIISFVHLHYGEDHINEVEVDIDSLIIRITLTTLKDSIQAVQRVLELIEISTKAMERRTHSNGRAQRTSGEIVSTDSPLRQSRKENTNDSLLLLKIQLKNVTILVGTYHFVIEPNLSDFDSFGNKAGAVQLCTNALIMFQSVENPDSSGTRTLHISVDDLSKTLINQLDPLCINECSPILGPLSAEFRAVYTTENFGEILFQDFSLGSNRINLCMAPNDFRFLKTLRTNIVSSLQTSECETQTQYPFEERKIISQNGRNTFVRYFGKYREKGSGVATAIRLELESFSFVILRQYQVVVGAIPFCELTANQIKARFDGLMTSLAGDLTSTVAVNFFNIEASDWDFVVEPFDTILQADQLPNELNISFRTSKFINMNMTSAFLRDLSEFIILYRMKPSKSIEDEFMIRQHPLMTPVTPSSKSKSLTKLFSVSVVNESGVDLLLRSSNLSLKHLGGDEPSDDVLYYLLKGGSQLLFVSSSQNSHMYDNKFDVSKFDSHSFDLKLSSKEEKYLGKREAIVGLSFLNTPSDSATTHVMQCKSEEIDSNYHFMEPVVEFCLQNQRLRAGTTDIYSLQKGQDLLSSILWSPSDDIMERPNQISNAYKDTANVDGYWLRPYLNDDPPEWTDMTGVLRKEREDIVLPNKRWTWANEWTVNTNGIYGKTTDSDGWEYATEFETFNSLSRFYQRGDTCRRRIWTRTRFFLPSILENVQRPLNFVWHPSRDENGNYSMKIKSNLTIHNHTDLKLSVFAFHLRWEKDKICGSFLPGEKIHVPVSMTPVSHISLAIRRDVSDKITFRENTTDSYNTSERLMILPVSYTCFSIHRALIKIPNDELSYYDKKTLGARTYHFLVRSETTKGVSDIFIEPVLKIVNLLPCQLLFRLGDTAKNSKTESHNDKLGRNRKKFIVNEEGEVNIGGQMNSLSIDPRLNPHISLRIPGYKWSSWNLILNRKNPSDSWQTVENEDSTYVPSIDETDAIEEVQSIVRFEPLEQNNYANTIVLSTACGHFPTIKIYAQYWVLDETGFGLRISGGFEDILNIVPDGGTLRRSFTQDKDIEGKHMEKDLALPGNEWSIGRSGMTMFFSKTRFLTLCIESGVASNESFRSKWASPMDISNPTPKTVFALDEHKGQRRFELCYSVVICPSIYSRTKLVTFFPRYQIINLLNTELLVSQDGCSNSDTSIKPQSSVPFHWDVGTLPPQVRLLSRQCHPPNTKPKLSRKNWTNGTIKLDTIGITSMRLPSLNDNVESPMVAQVEVRLASKDQKSAVVVVIWGATEKSNPLYVLSNKSSFTVLCNQVLDPNADEERNGTNQTKTTFDFLSFANSSKIMNSNTDGNCLTQSIEMHNKGCSSTTDDESKSKILVNWNNIKCEFDHSDSVVNDKRFIWSVPRESTCIFGFEDPNLPHVLEWTCISENGTSSGQSYVPSSRVKVDAMGDANFADIQGGIHVGCQIRAEHSTKIIEFFDATDNSIHQLFGNQPEILDSIQKKMSLFRENDEINEIEVSHEAQESECSDIMTFTFQMMLPGMAISVVDNLTDTSCREILYLLLSGLAIEFAQTYDGYHELEIKLTSLQLDNHVFGSEHPVMISHPFHEEGEPYLHMSIVRRLQEHVSTFVFRYLAFRILDTDINLDRRTTETLLTFLDPIRRVKRINSQKADEWIKNMTMNTLHRRFDQNNRLSIDTEEKLSIAKFRRVYLEHFHLHPIRLSLTFSQKWTDNDINAVSEGVHIFQFVRSMPSLTNAPLTFTSFVVSHAFESPQALIRILGAHYLSQLVRQMFAILGSLTILNGPADFFANVGTGVRDFFYEPINGLVHGPAQFLEGLETGALSLARGVIFGVVRGAAQVADLVTLNIAGLTDKDFIDERNAYKRSLMDARIRGNTPQTLNNSLYLAGESIVRSVKSGAVGMIHQPSIYASKHGSAGLVQGMGKALVGAVLKPMVGVGDAVVLVLNHVTDATSITKIAPKFPKRLRRALPQKGQCVQLIPYDKSAAEAQSIVTDKENVNDVYVGHVQISSHLIIASEKSLWAISRTTNEQSWFYWEEISHFSTTKEKKIKVNVFSQEGLKSHIFSVSSQKEFSKLYNLLYIQTSRMGNSSNSICELDSIPAIKVKQQSHNFGSLNNRRIFLRSTTRDETGLITRCCARVRLQGSESSSFFKDLDEEAWSLISCWGQMFTGLSSKRCIVAGFINGTHNFLQIRSTNVVEGGSPCYRITSKEYDESLQILAPGGAMILFAWGSIPNFIHEGHVSLQIETNAFVCNLFEEKNSSTLAIPLPGFQVRFLEKSYDSNGWWAKYWLLVS